MIDVNYDVRGRKSTISSHKGVLCVIMQCHQHVILESAVEAHVKAFTVDWCKDVFSVVVYKYASLTSPAKGRPMPEPLLT